MSLADQLVVRAFVPRFLASLGATLAVHMAVECIDLANQTGASALLRYPLRIPQAVVFVTPIALLVAGCWTGAHLRRTGQLIALAAAGRGARRGLLVLPIIGVLCAGLMWPIAFEAAPRGLASFSTSGEEERWPRWVRTDEEELVRIGGRDGDGSYTEILVLELTENGQLDREIEASKASRTESGWELDDVTIRENGGSVRSLALLKSPRAPQLPDVLSSAAPQHLTGAELRHHGASGSDTGRESAPYEAERGLRAALVLLCIPCIALGALVGVRFGKRPGLTAGVTALVGLAVWAIVSPCWAIAASGGADVSWVFVAGVPTGVTSALGGMLWFSMLR